MRSSNLGRWLVRWGDSGPADLSLICFPYAGAGPSVYCHWADLLPDRVAVCAVHLPGRGARFGEPLLTNIDDMARAVAAEIAEWIEPPFAFFGHSMGAALAFETARLLRAAGAPGPRLLIASGRTAPHLASRERPVGDLPPAALVVELGRCGATPRQVLSDPDLLDAVLPIVRADLRAIETYRYTPGEPLDCPVTAFGGADDPTVCEDELRGWREHTWASFSLRTFPGCHFFHQEDEKQVVAEIAATLRPPGATAVLPSGQPSERPGSRTPPAGTDAWVLHQGPAPGDGAATVRGALRRECFTLPDLADDEVLVEPLYGSWEANIDHALSRQPIDVCRARHDDRVVLGNAGVVRVLRAGPAAGARKPGELCLVMPFSKRDSRGYAELIYAYDAPHTIGILATRTNVRADMLLPLPEHTSHALPRWAAYGRYFTAWDNWRVAHGCWLTQMAGQEPASQLVFGWGGGATFAELQLAQRAGFRVAMTASTDERLAYLTRHGIGAVDRRLFPDLYYDPDSAGADPDGYLRRYRAAEKQFLKTIDTLSEGAGVAIFIDNIGAPLYKATVKALARQGVLATVGWKQGMRTYDLRASECIKRHLHINTHVWRYDDGAAIRDYQESTGWLPEIDPGAVYEFDRVPRLAEDYLAGKLDTYFPLFQVNPV